jgi:hypothetical protein
VAMRIRTQNLPNSFSSDYKKQKVVLPETARRASVLGEIDLEESIDKVEPVQIGGRVRG